jgi:hypothetical protein
MKFISAVEPMDAGRNIQAGWKYFSHREKHEELE